jgi:cellulose synthase/poly-beta-1,6-N-acetylglucosamine synthase-like glycosyltransferase
MSAPPVAGSVPVSPRVSVLVPTYRRPDDLRRCLRALASQALQADEVIVVLRQDDSESIAAASDLSREQPAMRRILVNAAGVVHALNSGLEAATGDIVAITDDDAAPRPDWLQRIVAIVESDPRVGGVGGRDWVHHGERTEIATRRTVGRLQWYGRCIGNHHLGAGAAREVWFLKGVNMSFRRAAIGKLRFDARLRGSGAQVCNDMAFSLAIRRAGWKLIYDPQVAVDHYPAARFDEDQRNAVSHLACYNAAFNEALVVSEALGRLRSWVFVLWAVTVGTRSAPGWLQWLRLRRSEGPAALIRTRAAISGGCAGRRAAWS